MPEIIIIQLMHTSDLTVGSHLEDLVTILHDHYKEHLFCVRHILSRSSLEILFNKNVVLLNKYLKTVLKLMACAFLWSHRGSWNIWSLFLFRDGVHLTNRGKHKLCGSMRGAVLKCSRLLSDI